MKVVFLGLGYIGLPTAFLVADQGIEVVGVDNDQEKIKKLNSNKLSSPEKDIQNLINKVLKKDNFRAQSSPEKGDIFFIVVPTPIKKNKHPDLSQVKSAIKSIIPFLSKGNLVIIESTVPLSTTESLSKMIFKKRPDLEKDIDIAYCPERVLPGNIIYELKNNDRVIGGINNRSTKKAVKFYKKFVSGKLHETDSKTAELCKLTENSYRDLQIAFANELSIICDKSKLDVWNLIQLANNHPRVNILKPSSGVGGHCIAVDPWFLISSFPEESKLIQKARHTNLNKTDWCLKKINQEIKKFKKLNKRYPIISCMGITYKPDVKDTRESPSRKIALELLKNKKIKTLVCEPNLDKDPVIKFLNLTDCYKKSDIVIWLVGHQEFIKFERDPKKIEIDFCEIN